MVRYMVHAHSQLGLVSLFKLLLNSNCVAFLFLSEASLMCHSSRGVVSFGLLA